MQDWYSTLYKGFSLVAIITFLIGFFSTNKTVSLNSYISGYFTLSIGLFILIGIIIKNMLGVIENEPILKVITHMGSNLSPFILTLLSLTFILYSVFKYRTNIINGKISDSYYSFNNIFLFLILSQIYILYKDTVTPHFESTKMLSAMTKSLVYLFGTLGCITSFIVFVILKYFSTDGFTNYLSIKGMIYNKSNEKDAKQVK
jgi:hypothetical protein